MPKSFARYASKRACTRAGMHGSDPGSASAALQGPPPELSRKDSRPQGCLRSPGFSRSPLRAEGWRIRSWTAEVPARSTSTAPHVPRSAS
eukprot:1105732-Pyramimonas_sp.AAC.1